MGVPLAWVRGNLRGSTTRESRARPSAEGAGPPRRAASRRITLRVVHAHRPDAGAHCVCAPCSSRLTAPSTRSARSRECHAVIAGILATWIEQRRLTGEVELIAHSVDGVMLVCAPKVRRRLDDAFADRYAITEVETGASATSSA